jgi:hypothetical protein
VSEIVVIDREGRHYSFDADSYTTSADGYVAVLKGGNPVATFTPSYIGVYEASAVYVPGASS